MPRGRRAFRHGPPDGRVACGARLAGGDLQRRMVASATAVRPYPRRPQTPMISQTSEHAVVCEGNCAMADTLGFGPTGGLAAVLTHHFQPIWDLRRDCLLGFEALARFADGTPPATVWQAARAQGLAHALDRASTESALAAARGLPGLLFLNVCASTLASSTADARTVRRLLGEGRLDRTVFEVTEDGLPAWGGGSERARLTLHTLSRLGVAVALDDAGTGEATPERLTLLAPALAYVKLDRSLVRDWLRGEGCALEAWVRRAGARGLPCVAEGVEDTAAAAPLLSAGVACVQGYAFGAPAPAATWTAERLDILRPRPVAPALV